MREGGRKRDTDNDCFWDDFRKHKRGFLWASQLHSIKDK